MKPIQIKATRQQLNQVATHVYHLVLQSEQLNADSYLAGQYLNICMPDGSSRPFSIASAANSNQQLELIIRAAEDAPVSMEILTHLQDADEITIELPLGRCILDESDLPLAFIAGGTGIAPIRAMLQHLASIQSNRAITLYWGVNSEVDFFLLDDVKQTVSALSNAEFVPVCAKPTADWQGATGYPHQAMIAKQAELKDTQIYICGSMEMVKAVYHDLVDTGASPYQLHSDMLDIMRQFGQLPPL